MITIESISSCAIEDDSRRYVTLICLASSSEADGLRGMLRSGGTVEFSGIGGRRSLPGEKLPKYGCNGTPHLRRGQPIRLTDAQLREWRAGR